MKINIKYIYLICLIVEHYLFSFFSYKDSFIYQNTDYYNYYNQIVTENFSLQEFLSLGATFFVAFNKIFSGVNFLQYSFIYSTLSLIPFVSLLLLGWNSFEKASFTLKFLFILSLFLPSTHYWLGSFSKDAFCFFSVFLIFYYYYKQKTKLFTFLIVLSFSLMTIIRPYVGILVLFTMLFFVKKKYILPLFLSLLFFGVIFLYFFLEIKYFSIESILEKYSHLNNYSYSNSTKESIINLMHTTVFSRFFYVMFRPLFFDATTFYKYIISIENFVLIVIFLMLSYKLVRYKTVILKYENSFYYALGVYAFSTWLFYSLYVYNYGLASRMKANYIVFLLYFFFVSFSKLEKIKK